MLSDIDCLSKCTSLQHLVCSENELSNIDCLSKCTSLQYLVCSDNRLKNLNGISGSTSLTYLYCSHNNLENLDDLFNCTSLQELDCSNNKLKNLNGISNCTSLKELNCNDNVIETLIPILNLKNLQKFSCNRDFWSFRYGNFNIDYTLEAVKLNSKYINSQHPAVQRFLNKIKNGDNMYCSNDTQNIHDLEINKNINTLIINLMKTHSNHIKSEKEIIEKLLEHNFSSSEISDLINYLRYDYVHPYFNVTYFEVFQLVFAEIEHLNYNPEILNRLKKEIKNFAGMCFTKYIIQTIECLNSFSSSDNIKSLRSSEIDTIKSLINDYFEKDKIMKEKLLESIMTFFKNDKSLKN